MFMVIKGYTQHCWLSMLIFRFGTCKSAHIICISYKINYEKSTMINKKVCELYKIESRFDIGTSTFQALLYCQISSEIPDSPKHLYFDLWSFLSSDDYDGWAKSAIWKKYTNKFWMCFANNQHNNLIYCSNNANLKHNIGISGVRLKGYFMKYTPS